MNLFCNFKYELIADNTRRSALSRFAGCRRAVFNKALELQNDRKERKANLVSRNGSPPRGVEADRGDGFSEGSAFAACAVTM